MSKLELSVCIKRGNFSLQVMHSLPANGTTAIFGKSGCGKTSLLRAIAGLDRYENTSVGFKGTIWQDPTVFVPAHKRRTGFVFQDDNLLSHLSAMENLRFAACLANTPEMVLEKIISLLGLQNLLTLFPADLSGGQKQKVAIARALVSQPPLLLFDEPLAGLDHDFRQTFIPQLKALLELEKIPLLYVSHATEEVAQLADHLLLIEQGQTTAGPFSAMLTDPACSLASRADAESVIDATVTGYDQQYGLLTLEFAGGNMQVSGRQMAAGTPVRVRILAQDVSLTIEHQQQTSILNIFPATIKTVFACSDSQDTVLLALEGIELLARITRKSKALLGLSEGMLVYAQIKSVAVLQ